MSNPLSRTIRMLAASSSPQAGATLLHALHAADAGTLPQIAAAVLERGIPRELGELVSRFGELPEPAQSVVLQSLDRLAPAFRQILQQAEGTTELRRQAIELARQSESGANLPILLSAQQKATGTEAEQISIAIAAQIDRLFDQLRPGARQAPPGSVEEAKRVRTMALQSLRDYCQNFTVQSVDEQAVEAVLILGTEEDGLFSTLVSSSRSVCAETVSRLFLESRHPGVFERIIELLTRLVPHSLARMAVEERRDPQFVCFLLRSLRGAKRALLERGLRSCRKLAWLDDAARMAACVPLPLQIELVALAFASSAPREQKQRLLEWMRESGTAAARSAAEKLLGDRYAAAGRPVKKHERALNDVQLELGGRAAETPDLSAELQRAIEQLDSPLRETREAARRQLAGFELQRMLLLFDDYDHALCRRAGEIVRKVDGRWLESLLRELASPLPTRRIRAIRGAEKLGLHARVVPALTALTEDADADVRRATVEALGSLSTRTAVEALQPLLKDSSPRIRTAAAGAIRRILHAMRNDRGAAGKPRAA